MARITGMFKNHSEARRCLWMLEERGSDAELQQDTAGNVVLSITTSNTLAERFASIVRELGARDVSVDMNIAASCETAGP